MCDRRKDDRKIEREMNGWTKRRYERERIDGNGMQNRAKWRALTKADDPI